MDADVRLDGEHVYIDGRVVHVAATDLMLDSPDRRGDAFVGSAAEHRRAMVHSTADVLVINYGGDYVSVRIDSPLRVQALSGHDDELSIRSRVVRMQSTDVMLDDTERRSAREGLRRALVHDAGDRLTLNYEGDYPGGVSIHGSIDVPGQLTVGGADVAAELAQLRGRVERLEHELGLARGRRGTESRDG